MLRPDARIVTALIGFDDRNMANQSLLYGYGMSLEPYNFKGRPGDMPETVRYGVAVDELRSTLSEWLWNGALVEDPGVRVDVAGAPDDVRFTVWHDTAGERCVVVANYAEAACRVSIAGLGDALLVHRPGEGSSTGDARDITIPARSAVAAVASL